LAASSPIRRPQVAPTIRFSLATHVSSPPVPPSAGRTLVGIRQSLPRARGKEALALPVAEKARAPFPQRSKTARISVSPQQFSGTARWTGGPLAVDEVPAKRQFSAISFAALVSSLLSRLRRDARWLGFACISFRLRGTRKEIKVFTSVRTGSCTVHLAVPGECCGLTLILAFSDRCGNCELTFSATGSVSSQFHRHVQT